MTEHTATEQPTVLIVEDERGLADLYAHILEMKYSVITAYNGTEGLEAMSDEVDVVLLDRRMPGPSGEEVLETIREQGYECRVAMVTAVGPDLDVLEMEFDEYLMKPVEQEELYAVVDRLLELRTYDDLMVEYHRLTWKRFTLESEKPGYDFSEYDEFVELMERIDELEEELAERDSFTDRTDVRDHLDIGTNQSND